MCISIVIVKEAIHITMVTPIVIVKEAIHITMVTPIVHQQSVNLHNAVTFQCNI